MIHFTAYVFRWPSATLLYPLSRRDANRQATSYSFRHFFQPVDTAELLLPSFYMQYFMFHT